MYLSLHSMTTGPRARLWNREEYYRLAELGLIPQRRVQLIEGEIFEMSPHGGRHAVALQVTYEELRKAFGKGFTVRCQLPLALGPRSEPEPDLAVVPGDPRDYLEHPTTALLVVEISDSSLEFDVTRKAALYARAGLQEYWVVNVEEGKLLVHRGPLAGDQFERGAGYRSIQTLFADDSVSPLAIPNTAIEVKAMLP